MAAALLSRVSVDELSPTHAEQQKREQILASLERFIRKEYNGEELKLLIYSSSNN